MPGRPAERVEVQNVHQLDALTRTAAAAPEGPVLPLGPRVQMLEWVIAVQRAAVRRASLQEVFDAVTAGAHGLLGDEIVGLRLRDRADPSMLQVVSVHGLPDRVAWRLWRMPVTGSGAAGQAVIRDEVVVLDSYADSRDGIRELAETGVCAAMAAPVHDDDGEVIGSLVVASRRPERTYTAADRGLLAAFAEHVGVAIADAQAVDGLEQVFRDPLTGLASRALFNDRLAHALACAERDQSRTSVLMVDLDRFRGVNDSLGHAVGDLLLAAVGERLRGCVRTTDTVARLSADEFAMLLHDVELRDRAVSVANRVLQALHQPFPINGRDMFINASIGIAFGAVGHQDAETLLQYADLALHTAKKNGKGRFEVFEPVMHAALKKGADLESDLRLAVDRDEFVLRYQPIVELHSGRVSGFEALVRWLHPQLGMVPPLDFIPLAEETGLIVPIGTWVLQEACRQAADWNRRRAATEPLSISVNLSALQLQQPHLPQLIADVLASTGLAGRCLTLELTESLLINDVDTTVARLGELKALGIRLAIDDFGTGYSSLAYLRRFPIDILKIDKLFVDAVATEAPEASLTGAIVHLARTLHLSTVAEGIESVDQCEPLRDSGCQLGQGYYFAKPLTSTDAETLLFTTTPVQPVNTAGTATPGAA